HLDISRPAPDKSQTEQRTPPKMIRVNIYTEGGQKTGYSLNGRTVSLAELTSILNRLASFSQNQTVLITCAGGSEHAKLIGVLDICAQSGLSKISVVSAE
ncbi:MAG: biopolymer transporter ExbD, partial [Kiritimatiellales bacterium]